MINVRMYTGRVLVLSAVSNDSTLFMCSNEKILTMILFIGSVYEKIHNLNPR